MPQDLARACLFLAADDSAMMSLRWSRSTADGRDGKSSAQTSSIKPKGKMS
jgi:hypothetical protein